MEQYRVVKKVDMRLNNNHYMYDNLDNMLICDPPIRSFEGGETKIYNDKKDEVTRLEWSRSKPIPSEQIKKDDTLNSDVKKGEQNIYIELIRSRTADIQLSIKENSLDWLKPWMRIPLSFSTSSHSDELKQIHKEEEIDHMKYCKEANDKQLTINKLRNELTNIELKTIKAKFNTIQRQTRADPTDNWLKMIKTDPYYQLNIMIKTDPNYKWFKMINTEMRRYQKTYHSIKTHYPKH